MPAMPPPVSVGASPASVTRIVSSEPCGSRYGRGGRPGGGAVACEIDRAEAGIGGRRRPGLGHRDAAGRARRRRRPIGAGLGDRGDAARPSRRRCRSGRRSAAPARTGAAPSGRARRGGGPASRRVSRAAAAAARWRCARQTDSVGPSAAPDGELVAERGQRPARVAANRAGRATAASSGRRKRAPPTTSAATSASAKAPSSTRWPVGPKATKAPSSASAAARQMMTKTGQKARATYSAQRPQRVSASWRRSRRISAPRNVPALKMLIGPTSPSPGPAIALGAPQPGRQRITRQHLFICGASRGPRQMCRR